MKAFLQKLFLWLPLAFLFLVLADMFFLHEHSFRTSYSVLQAPALAGLTMSFLVASILETITKIEKNGFRNIYTWHVAAPVIMLLILITLALMSK